MRPSQFNSSVRSVHSFFDDLGLLRLSMRLDSMDASAVFKKAALSSGIRYAQLFKIGLRNRDYNFLLEDFSFFQFSYVKLKTDYTLRYGYYPNPFAVTTFEEFSEAILGETDIGDYELYMLYLEEAEDDHYLVPPIRYEVSFQYYAELVHPTSHLHLGMHDENRWPASLILNPLTFSMHIAKMFYSNHWSKGMPIHEDRMNRYDEMFCREKDKCAVLDNEYFSRDERRQLFLS